MRDQHVTQLPDTPDPIITWRPAERASRFARQHRGGQIYSTAAEPVNPLTNTGVDRFTLLKNGATEPVHLRTNTGGVKWLFPTTLPTAPNGFPTKG